MVDPKEMEQLPTTEVPIGSLLMADSPRRDGEDLEHVRVLAQSDVLLPPITVRRESMRVIDGMHRLRAAKMSGRQTISVHFFDGDEPSAFVLAVKGNVTHGLPLSMADRKAAASRILGCYPRWSNHMVAQATALSAKTIAALRGRPTQEQRHLDARVGRDGRVRPLDGAERRARAAALMADDPGASLRDVARQCGLSPETVRSVRSRAVPRPESPKPTLADAGPALDHTVVSRSDRSPPGLPATEVVGHSLGLRVMLQNLTSDPSVRSSDLGRALLHALAAAVLLDERGEHLADMLPAHCLDLVAVAARSSADAWHDFADLIDGRRLHVASANRTAALCSPVSGHVSTDDQAAQRS